MGQYWNLVNLDKKEFVNPHQVGTGLKLWEQLANHPGTGANTLARLQGKLSNSGLSPVNDALVAARTAIDKTRN